MNTESYAQQQYYIKHRRHHNTITFLRIFLLIAFLILWETASHSSGSHCARNQR